MRKGSQITLREPVIIAEGADTVFLPKGTAGIVTFYEENHLTILVEGKEYDNIPLESIEEVTGS